MEQCVKLTKAGAITIPVAMRREMGLKKGDVIKLANDGKFNFSAEVVTCKCQICNRVFYSNDGLNRVGKIYVCDKCAKSIVDVYSSKDC